MKCSNCPYYYSGYMYNSCAVMQAEYFRTTDNCTLVKEDGALNVDDEYIKMEYGENADPYVLMNQYRED